MTVTTWPGAHPVQLWSLEGVGHMVPGRTDLDPRLGPGTDAVSGGEIISGFFGF